MDCFVVVMASKVTSLLSNRISIDTSLAMFLPSKRTSMRLFSPSNRFNNPPPPCSQIFIAYNPRRTAWFCSSTGLYLSLSASSTLFSKMLSRLSKRCCNARSTAERGASTAMTSEPFVAAPESLSCARPTAALALPTSEATAPLVDSAATGTPLSTAAPAAAPALARPRTTASSTSSTASTASRLCTRCASLNTSWFHRSLAVSIKSVRGRTARSVVDGGERISGRRASEGAVVAFSRWVWARRSSPCVWRFRWWACTAK